MAVKLRLMRMGKRHRPHYRVCVVDSRKPQGGEYIESIGHYDPLIDDDNRKITIDKDRAEHWLRVGAQPTETVASFLRRLAVPGLSRPTRKRRRRRSAGNAGSGTAGKAKKKAAKKSARKKKAKKAKKAEKKAKKTT